MTQNSINNTASGLTLGSATAYAVVCGGTSTANPLQPIASVGSAGQVLTSNGAGALPTFQAAAAAVYFSAALSTPTALAATNPIIFDTIRVNAGSGYNGATGQFTAPVSAFYFFSAQVGLSAVTIATTDFFVQITNTTSGIAAAYQFLQPFNTYAPNQQEVQVTAAGGVYCTAGDVVSVQATVIGTAVTMWTTSLFQGFKVS